MGFVKRTILGTVFVAVNLAWSEEARRRLLATWHTPAKRSFAQRWLFRAYFSEWIRNVYLQEPSPEKREALKDICMGGDSGVEWAADYDSRPIDLDSEYLDLDFRSAHPWYDALRKELEKCPTAQIIQIGSSSGRELAYYARDFPNASFVGTDIDEHIARRASAVYPIPNVRFAVARAHEILKLAEPSRPLLIFSSGSLQYVQPEHLELMFQLLSTRGDLKIILGEPWKADGQAFGKRGNSRWRGNFSYSHDYSKYGEAAEFATEALQIVQIAKDPASFHYLTRHYFYQATLPDRER